MTLRREQALEEEALQAYFTIAPVSKHGSKRCGIRAEKRETVIE